MWQSAAAASPTLFEFAVLFISFCPRPLLPTRKLQNRNEFPPGKPNKRNRLFLLGSFESNILWNTTYFGARRLGTFYFRFLADSSENNVVTVLSFGRFKGGFPLSRFCLRTLTYVKIENVRKSTLLRA